MKAALPWLSPEACTISGALVPFCKPLNLERNGVQTVCVGGIYSQAILLSNFKGFLVALQGPLNQMLKADTPTKTHDIWCFASMKTRQFHFCLPLFAFWPVLIDTWRRGSPCCLLFIYDETYTGNLFFSIKSHPGGTSCPWWSLQGRDIDCCTLDCGTWGYGLRTRPGRGSQVWRKARVPVVVGGCPLWLWTVWWLLMCGGFSEGPPQSSCRTLQQRDWRADSGLCFQGSCEDGRPVTYTSFMM